MKPVSNTTTFVLPPALQAEVEAAADEEHRPVAEVVLDLVERGLSERRWQAHAEKEFQRARGVGLPDDAQPMIDEYRRTICEKITQGVQSLREGRVVDGETFMARMNAELATSERQGK